MSAELQSHPTVNGSTSIGDVKRIACDRTGELSFRRPGSAVLYCEQVGEVSIDEALEDTYRGLVTEVVDDDVFAHSLTDIAVPKNHQCRVGATRRGSAPGDESGGIRIRVDCRKGFERGATDHQLEPRDHALVTDEKSLGGARNDVAGSIGYGEGRLVDKGDDPLGSPQGGDPPSVGPRSRH